MPSKKAVVRHGRKKQNLGNGSPGETELELSAEAGAPEITGDEFPRVMEEELPQSASEIPDQIEDLGSLPVIPERMLRELHTAPKGATIRIKSVEDFQNVETYLAAYNPKKLSVEHRAGLGMPAVWIKR